MNSATQVVPEMALRNFFPEQIVLGENSRWQGTKDQNVNDLLLSIPLNGQQTPVDVWLDDKGNPHLVYGFRRVQAIKTINEGKKQEDELAVRCQVIPRPEPLDAFLRNIAENIDRKDTSPMDDAYAHEILRKKFKYSDKAIADRYHKTPSWVSQVSDLLDYVYEIQMMIHAGYLTMNDSKVCKTMTKKEQVAFAEQIAKENNTTIAEAADTKSRKRKKAKRKGKEKGKSLKEILGVLDIFSAKEEIDVSPQDLCKLILKWADSKKPMHDFVIEICGEPVDENENPLEEN